MSCERHAGPPVGGARFLGIDDSASFPPDVVAQLCATGCATYKRYGYPDAKHVIHVIGPDFKHASLGLTEKEAIKQLAEVYKDILTAARDHGKPLLRVLPVSSGIYAGVFRDRMAHLTAAALLEGFDMLLAEDPTRVKDLPPYDERRVELCIFNPAEVPEYQRALKRALGELDEEVRG